MLRWLFIVIIALIAAVCWGVAITTSMVDATAPTLMAIFFSVLLYMILPWNPDRKYYRD